MGPLVFWLLEIGAGTGCTTSRRLLFRFEISLSFFFFGGKYKFLFHLVLLIDVLLQEEMAAWLPMEYIFLSLAETVCSYN